jgi:hypothetical protein
MNFRINEPSDYRYFAGWSHLPTRNTIIPVQRILVRHNMFLTLIHFMARHVFLNYIYLMARHVFLTSIYFMSSHVFIALIYLWQDICS